MTRDIYSRCDFPWCFWAGGSSVLLSSELVMQVRCRSVWIGCKVDKGFVFVIIDDVHTRSFSSKLFTSNSIAMTLHIIVMVLTSLPICWVAVFLLTLVWSCLSHSMPRKFLGLVGQDPSDSKSNRIRVDIFPFCCINLRYFLQIPLKWWVILLKSLTSTGYFSNSSSSSVTNHWFSLSPGPTDFCCEEQYNLLSNLLHYTKYDI